MKICGITREEDLAVAAAAEADAVGFVVGVPSSPRNLSIEKAEALMKHKPIFLKSVVVAPADDVSMLVKIYENLKPDAVQVHGKNTVDFSVVREKMPNVRLIKTVYANSTSAVNEAVKASGFFDAVLLDSFSQGKFGGTGVVHNWEFSRRIRQKIEPRPLILAGGLTPENVQGAVRFVQPYAVDVSSGVELCPGIKDQHKVYKFIKIVKRISL